MTLRPPTATIRTQVALPLRFADGYATDARVFSFDGLVDGREHLAFALARQLRSCGVTVVAQVPTAVHLSPANARSLETKVRRGEHTLALPLPAW